MVPSLCGSVRILVLYTLMKSLLLIDGNGLVHRAYHALPEFTSRSGQPTGAVYGFISTLNKVISDYRPTHVITCFDTPAPTFRDSLFINYRTQRPEADKELKDQFPLVKEFLDAAGVAHVEKEGLEADDLIGVLATQAHKRGFVVNILTGDKYIFQLVNNNIFVITPQIGYGHEKKYDRRAVIEKFGIPPERVADLKALAGDPSDNYKGIVGIGPKTASQLINKFGPIENIYENIDQVENPILRQKLINGKGDAELSKKLAQLVIEADIPVKVDDGEFIHYNESLKYFFNKYNFRSLYNRIFGTSTKPEKIEKPKKKENQLDLFN